MSTVLDVLKKAQEGRGDLGAGFDELPPEPPRRRGPRWLWVLLGAVAVIAAFAWGLELSGREDEAALRNDSNGTRVASAPAALPETETPVGVASAPAEELSLAPPPDVRPKRKSSPRSDAGKKLSPAEADMRADVERQTRVPVRMRDPAAPDSGQTQAAPINERRRKVLERVMERRARREERRAQRLDSREDSREESRELRSAIRSAATPEERESLLQEFRELRRVARAERKAASTQRRLAALEKKEGLGEPARVASAPGALPAPQVGDVTPRSPVAPSERTAPPAASEPGAPAGMAGAAPGTPVVVAEVAAEPIDEGLRRPPSNAPQVRINILQYSTEPRRRFAYMSIDGNPSMTQVREGESYQGLTVKRIFPEKIEFAHEGSTFLLRAN